MNQHIRRPEVIIVDPAGLALHVGDTTPYPAFDGTALNIGPSGLSLIVSLPHPSRPQLRALRSGSINLGIMASGHSAIALWRFADRTRPVVLETPFHIGLLPENDRWIPTATGPGETLPVLIIVQDERRVCRAIRLLPLPVRFSRALEDVVVDQAREASQPAWSPEVHKHQVEQYFRTYPDAATALAACEQYA